MLYEYALISVVIACGYWGYFFLRHPPSGTPLFGIMQVGAAVLSGIGVLGRGHPVAGICGAIGIGAGVCLLVVGPIVRSLARRFAAAERIGIASRLLDVAEILAPGSGVAEEKALLATMKEIREGRVEETVEALTTAKYGAPPDARLAIDERIAMLYLAAYRWRDAIEYAEEHLIPGIERPAPPASVSLRDALGIAPPVWVELLGAYARTGNLDQAARMMTRLEDVCSGREDASLWLHRARMMFLALAGRPDAVQSLVAPRRARHMSHAARTYWVAVAHEHSGNREAATAAYEKARGRSRGRPRELIDEALAKMANASRVTLSPEASEIVAKVESSPMPAPIKIARSHAPWATWGLTAALLGVAGVISFTLGPSSDPGVLVRAGAMSRDHINNGEWWRVVACVFIHVGTLHLLINAVGLFFLGRVLEELFGTARTLVIFVGSGVAGAFASYLGSPVGISAGASGAIFGVLGAVFIELTLHRDRYRNAWKRGMWGALAVVTIAQVAVGFAYPVIDQWAHGAGLAAGLALGALLSPSLKFARATKIASRVLAVGCGLLVAFTAVQVARTSIADGYPPATTRYTVGDVSVMAPAGWMAGDALVDPDRLFIIVFEKTPLPAALANVASDAQRRGFDRIEEVPDRVVTLPSGWEGTEVLALGQDEMDEVQRYRAVTAGKQFGDQTIIVRIYAPDTIVQALAEQVARLIGSVGPR